jgi:branched-chain amino acid transport system substrate-binding protein
MSHGRRVMGLSARTRLEVRLTIAARCTAIAISAMLMPSDTRAQEVVRIGVIMTYSGQFADAATQMDNGIKLYMREHGETVAGRRIEIIRRDTGGIAPDVAKRLAQELIVRDKVDLLAGFVTTPNTLAATDVSVQAKKFMVIMNAGTSIVTTRSPYAVRTSYTLAQVAEPLGAWAYRAGARKAFTMVLDLAPGHDGEEAYQRTFKEAGGEIVGSLRFPVGNPDFSAYVQRAKDLNPDAIFVFVPGGAQPAALGKAIAGRGIDLSKTRIIGNDVLTDDSALKSMGDISLGIVTGAHYDHNLKDERNRDFVKAYNEAYGRNPDLFSVGGYDGMHLIYEALKKTSGVTDAEKLIAVARGMSWQSPRGPMSIDPETRDVVQTVYIRQVEKVGDSLVNSVLDKIDNVKDPVKARMKN